VLITTLLCGGWPPGAPSHKVAAMSFTLASVGAFVHHACALDPRKRDYAYTCCKLTLVLTSLANFADSNAAAVLRSVFLRVVTIIIGGTMALVTSLVVLPEYASQAQCTMLAKACLEADSLLAAIVAQHGVMRKRPTPFPELRASELRLASLLEKYNALVVQAAEERRLHLGLWVRRQSPPAYQQKN
jgi:hypothetical protein